MEMETKVQNMNPDDIKQTNSNPYSSNSLSQKIDLEKYIYDVTPIGSKINAIEEKSKTQSLITLSDLTYIKSNQCSISSINVSSFGSEKNFTSNIALAEDLAENNCDVTSTNVPLVIINAKRSKKLHHKKIPPRTTNKKFQTYFHLLKHKILHSKYNHPEKNIRRNLETHRGRTKKNCSNRRIMEDLCSDLVLQAYRPSRTPRKVMATENLLDETDKIFFKDLDKMLEIDSSKDTLTRINSESSQNDSICTKTASSVVEIPTKISAIEGLSSHTIVQTQSNTNESSNPSDESIYTIKNEEQHISYNKSEVNNVNTIKSDFINVAIAQVTDTSILKYNTGTSSEQSQEEILYKENLTSAESFKTQSGTINIPLEVSEKNTINLVDDKTCIVLSDFVNNFDHTSDSDAFVIANTSSYFKNNSDSFDLSSNQTLTPSSELSNQTEPCNIYFQSTRKGEGKSSLLDTVINVGIFQLPISTEIEQYSTETSNKVIIIDELRRIPLPLKTPTPNNFSKSVIQKSFSVDNEGDRHKSILPNEETIRSIITETEKIETKPRSGEFRNHVPPPDVWEKLIVFLDISMRRMEESLVQKIGNELKSTLEKFEKCFPFTTLEEHDFVKSDIKFYNETEKCDLSKMESGHLTLVNKSMQCGLVQNEVIDKLMSKIISDGKGDVESPLRAVKSKIRIRKLIDSFEVLKPPVLPCTSNDRENGNLTLTSSSELFRVKKPSSLSKKRRLLRFTGPIRFLKANMLVLISVPAFFLSIFLLYTFFALLM